MYVSIPKGVSNVRDTGDGEYAITARDGMRQVGLYRFGLQDQTRSSVGVEEMF